MKINILGAEWQISIIPESEDEDLAERDGYSDWTIRKIVIKNEERKPGELHDIDVFTRKVMRHEIVHAFLFESGLMENSESVKAWASSEEMVDWIAMQGPKIYAAWKEAGCL